MILGTRSAPRDTLEGDGDLGTTTVIINCRSSTLDLLAIMNSYGFVLCNSMRPLSVQPSRTTEVVQHVRYCPISHVFFDRVKHTSLPEPTSQESGPWPRVEAIRMAGKHLDSSSIWWPKLIGYNNRIMLT